MATKRSTPPAPPSPETQTLIDLAGSLMFRMMQFVAERFRRQRSEASQAKMLDGQSRLASLSRKLRELLARIDAGTLPEVPVRQAAPEGAKVADDTECKPRESKPRESKARESKPRESKPRARPALGRGFGWLVKGYEADRHNVMIHRGLIEQLLNRPEMLERLGRAPGRAGRILRPLCHGLMLQPPEAFRLPPRPRKPRPRKPRPPKPRPVQEVRVMSTKWPRVASAHWPKGCVLPGETVPLRKRNRSRSRRQE